jgi:hypothetical protein
MRTTLLALASLLGGPIGCAEPPTSVGLNLKTSRLSAPVGSLEITAYRERMTDGNVLDCSQDRAQWATDAEVVLAGGPTVITGESGAFGLSADGEGILLDVAAFASRDATGLYLARGCVALRTVKPGERVSVEIALEAAPTQAR